VNREQAIKSQVKGFLVPEFTMDFPGGGRLNGLTEPDFERVRAGYACAECLAVFDTYTVTCPVCGLARDLGRDIADAPSLWVQHINERNQDEPSPRRTIDPAAEIARLGAHPDVEQIQLDKLTPKRRPRA